MTAPIRKLAAILAADVAGYSKLMGEDETGTLGALRELRQDLLRPTVEEHRGEVVKSMGDGWLVEFASVVDAVNCALQIQESLAGHEIIKLRIGIHIGDIVHEDEDIYGDGVNVAARLQEIAEPGAVALSGRARDFLDSKLADGFRDAGEKQLKNIAEAVRVFVSGDGAVEPSDITAASTDALPLPDKPSIAVLPFDNMSADPEQEYFSDGISEDIITALARFRSLAVTARNTSFTYKGRAADLIAAGRELNVRYILEGSVRKAGTRIRITAQLIDTQSGNHLWAERFDRELDDIFDLQDEITETIATTIEPEITFAEIERAKRRRADNISAWDYYLRALPHFHLMTSEENRQAIEQLSRSVELDNQFVPALAQLSLCHTWASSFRWTENRRSSVDEAARFAKLAVSFDPSDPTANIALSWHYMVTEQMDQALAAAKTAVDQEPNSWFARCHLAGCLAFLDRPEEAFDVLRSIEAASRRDPWRFLWYMHAGNASFTAHKYENAIEVLDKGQQIRSSWIGFFTIKAASAGLLGRENEARDAVAQMLALVPRMSVAGVSRYPLFTSQETIELLLEGLRKAGLPEHAEQE